jgi:lysophospholipase L1-like esterase
MGQNGLAIPAAGYETELYKSILTKAAADKLIIMLGSNDLLQGLSADSVTAKMKRFISNLNIDKEKILLISPPAMKPGLWVDDDRIIENSQLLGDKYFSLSQSLGIDFTCSDKWNIELTYDGVHFSAAGHKAFAANLYNFLKLQQRLVFYRRAC